MTKLEIVIQSIIEETERQQFVCNGLIRRVDEKQVQNWISIYKIRDRPQKRGYEGTSCDGQETFT